MGTGSSSEFDEGVSLRNAKRHNPVTAARAEPFVPKSDHNLRYLRAWVKRTGLVSDYLGEAGTSASEKFNGVGLNLERNHEHKIRGSSPKIEIKGMRSNQKMGLLVKRQQERIMRELSICEMKTRRNIISEGMLMLVPMEL